MIKIIKKEKFGCPECNSGRVVTINVKEKSSWTKPLKIGRFYSESQYFGLYYFCQNCGWIIEAN